MARVSWRDRLVERLFGDLIAERVENAVKVIDDEYWTQISGGGGTLDEDWSGRKEDLEDALKAWRINPLARRIVSLTSDYVLGSGVRLLSDIPWVQSLLDEFWALNNMGQRCYAWCDELTRCGELFAVLQTDQTSGMTFVRAVPAVRIDRIETACGDLERELRFHETGTGELDGRWWQAEEMQGSGSAGMRHYAINRPVGCVRGDGDLTPILSWLARYQEWLQNRVRLNKYKTAFLWDVTITGRPGLGDTLRKKRFRYKSPPEAGSIVVHDDAEQWSAVSPKLEAWDAKDDGKAIRLMVAAGAGIPLHFLSEGESATRATAQEMGDPTFRHYYRRQLYFGWMLKDLGERVVRRANAAGRGRSVEDLKLSVQFPDVTKADNQVMAQSALLLVRALDLMAQHGWIDDRSAMEMALRFAGEFVDVATVMQRIEKNGPAKPISAAQEAGLPENFAADAGELAVSSGRFAADAVRNAGAGGA